MPLLPNNNDSKNNGGNMGDYGENGLGNGGGGGGNGGNEKNNNIFKNNYDNKSSDIPTIITGDKNFKNINNSNGIPGYYTPTDDKYKLFTIYGNDIDNEKLSGLPQSTTGSLSSIITTSIASSEPDPGSDKAGLRGTGSGGDDSNDEKIALNRPGLAHEEWWHTTLQVSVPFFLAGIGTIGAGIILGRVESWDVFKHIPELFILVPSLLGLKGNLDMCLASRLSTQANLGFMTSKKEIFNMIVGNISLVQVQAIVASFIVSIFAVCVGAALHNKFEFDHIVLMMASAMFTATSSCFVLDFVLVAVIIISKRYRLNPDNLATPLAASIGDVVSISLFSFIASRLFINIDTHLWICYIVIGLYFCLLPIWTIIVYRNKYTRPVLTTGWTPVLSALFISGLGGLVLDAVVGVFNGYVVFQPIINGIGGNLVSVQASKISTMLHSTSIIGIIPPYTNIFEYPWRALIKGVPYAKTARILILMSIPGQVCFIYAADWIHKGVSTIQYSFVLSYLCVSLVQIMLLLYIAHIITHSMWKWKIDPDNSSIPYLTALGDLFGSSFLALAFWFLTSIGQPYDVKTDSVDNNISSN